MLHCKLSNTFIAVPLGLGPGSRATADILIAALLLILLIIIVAAWGLASGLGLRPVDVAGVGTTPIAVAPGLGPWASGPWSI